MSPALAGTVMRRAPAGPRQPLKLSLISSADDLWLGLGEWNIRMSKFDHLYRRNAEEAQRQADQATSEEIRAAWLQLVQGWLALLPKPDLSREQAFDVQARA